MTMLKPFSRYHTIAVAAALLALAPPASAGDGTFAGGQDFDVAQAADVATGDFNNDGRPDLAAVSGKNDRVELLLQTPEGKLEPGSPVAVGDAPVQLAVADFNADGNVDLAVSNDGDNDISIRLGTGNGTFTVANDIQLGADPRVLVVGDFNADARDDLASAVQTLSSPHRGKIIVSFGGGNAGGFPAAKTFEHDADVLAVGDFNSDATEDLAFGSLFYGSVGKILPGTGAGDFGGPLTVPLSQVARSPRGWAVGDFDSDSNTDFVATHELDAVSVRMGAGNGTFPSGTTVPVDGLQSAVAVGDFNSDANEDFVVTAPSKGGVAHIRLGDGTGGFQPGADVAVGEGPRSVAVGDFNSDGNDDLAVANTGASSVSVRLGGGPALLAGNLLTNGGFEGPAPSGRVTANPPIPGWERTGDMYWLRYGAASHAFAPSWLAAPRYGTGGGRLLWGGNSAATDGITTAFQTVDVSQSADVIDTGRATANLSAYLGGTLAYTDRMTARADFLSEAGGQLGSLELGPVTAQDRHNLSTMLRRAGSARVPAGTRRIRVTLTSIDDDKTLSSATADNVKLTLSVAPPPAGPVTPTPQPAQAFGPDTLVTLAPARALSRARQPLTVRVRNRNAFSVAGRLSGAATVGAARLRLGNRALQVPQAAARTVRVPLPARARRHLVRTHLLRLRLTAVVIDPAGNARRVTKRIRLRLKSH